MQRSQKEYVSSNSATARVILLIISSPSDPTQMERWEKICKNLERNKHAFGNCKCSARLLQRWNERGAKDGKQKIGPFSPFLTPI